MAQQLKICQCCYKSTFAQGKNLALKLLSLFGASFCTLLSANNIMEMNEPRRFLTYFHNLSFFFSWPGFRAELHLFFPSKFCVGWLCSRKLFLVNAVLLCADGELSLPEAGQMNVQGKYVRETVQRASQSSDFGRFVPSSQWDEQDPLERCPCYLSLLVWPWRSSCCWRDLGQKCPNAEAGGDVQGWQQSRKRLSSWGTKTIRV